MKKYFINILLFFIIVVAIDVLYGVALQYMNNHAKGGAIGNRYYVCKKSNDDVLIFGSSRAKHHYVPRVIEDTLGVTCYNAGEDGNGIILSYGYLKMITERYSPKLIIYDVSRFDFCEDDNVKYVNYLKPYYYEKGIDSLFWSIEPKSRIMMCSNLDRFNTTCLRILGNYLHPITSHPNGYMPLSNTMPDEMAEQMVTNEVEGKRPVDNTKLEYFEKFILLAQKKNVNVVCCVSPMYRGTKSDEFYNPVKALCEKYDVPFMFFAYSSDVSEDRNLFQDKTHLNDRGARIFSSIVCQEIRPLLLK